MSGVSDSRPTINRRRRKVDRTARNVFGGTFIFDLYGEDPLPIWGDGDDVLWMPGEPAMLVAPEGTGKSSLAQQIALRRIGVVSGLFLGYSVEPLSTGEKVLYLAMDRPRQIARSLRRMVEPSDKRTLEDRLSVWRGPLPIDVTETPQTLADWIQDEFPGARDVVIDSLKDLAAGLSADDVGAAINRAIQELVARDYNVLTLHHNRKQGRDEKKQTSLDAVYGSRWLTGGQGSVVWLDGKPGSNVVEVVHLKPVINVLPQFKIVHNHAKGVSTVFHGEADLVALLVKHRKEGVTVEQAAVHVYSSNSQPDKQRARRALTKLTKENVARYEPGAAGGAGGRAKEARWFLREE
jgi:replicative DNA helicase